MSFGSNAAFIARGLLHQLDCRKLREEMAQGTAVPRKSVGRIACPIMESIDLDRDPSATDDREDRDSKIPIPDRSIGLSERFRLSDGKRIHRRHAIRPAAADRICEISFRNPSRSNLPWP